MQLLLPLEPAVAEEGHRAATQNLRNMPQREHRSSPDRPSTQRRFLTAITWTRPSRPPNSTNASSRSSTFLMTLNRNQRDSIPLASRSSRSSSIGNTQTTRIQRSRSRRLAALLMYCASPPRKFHSLTRICEECSSFLSISSRRLPVKNLRRSFLAASTCWSVWRKCAPLRS